MSVSNTDSKTDSMQSLLHKPIVHVCTSAQEFNVQGFIDALKSRYAGSLIQDVKYFHLPYNDIDKFSFRGTGIEVMILCHSIHNRRFAITDVMDALYDKFLDKAFKALSRERICVLVHDMPWEKIDEADKYSDQMDAFRTKQPSTFKHASLALIGGHLEAQGDEVQIREGSWAELEQFLRRAARAGSSQATAQQGRQQGAVTHQPTSTMSTGQPQMIGGAEEGGASQMHQIGCTPCSSKCCTKCCPKCCPKCGNAWFIRCSCCPLTVDCMEV